MSPDSEGLGAAVVADVGSSFTQSSGISYFSLYIYIFHIIAVLLDVMLLLPTYIFHIIYIFHISALFLD